MHHMQQPIDYYCIHATRCSPRISAHPPVLPKSHYQIWCNSMWFLPRYFAHPRLSSWCGWKCTECLCAWIQYYNQNQPASEMFRVIYPMTCDKLLGDRMLEIVSIIRGGWCSRGIAFHTSAGLIDTGKFQHKHVIGPSHKSLRVVIV